jgi:hypothetical protein
MNTQLNKLFVQYSLSEKDQYEIKQIYALLPTHKQNNLLQNFWNIASRLIQIEEEIREEREILVDTALIKIENTIELVKKELMSSENQKKINSLKEELS